ncbi:Vps52 / Sac2 family [Perilla frutescens var. hirtella]|nr:Vps52 / Sac2 family [Perilla frutescens var. hirtella]KAH6817465.1 Vps52 / Sac2 family [Perilla frutescens var. frutescens]
MLSINLAIIIVYVFLEQSSDFIRLLLDEDSSSRSERPITVSEVETIVKDFRRRWKAAIELMHNDVITSFSNFLCDMEILRAALTQLLLYYIKLSDCMKKIACGYALNKDLVSISSIMYEIRKYVLENILRNNHFHYPELRAYS